ncbi:MAG: outer membrane lipoprotein carrier protein LolA [Bacteroidota bacterium]|nr:outer membrane lipoprotein carrier protein LolA [Bacteroidota bacterium]
MRNMTSFCLALIVGLFLSSPLVAQDADALLNRLSDKAQSFEAYEIAYTSTLVDLKNDFELSQEGVVQIEGDRFHLNLGNYVIYCDGETVWTFEPEMNECYIDDTETMKEEGMDPAKLFTVWEDDFRREWMGRSSVEGRDCAHINLYAGTDKAYHTLQLFVDDNALEVVQIVMKGREGSDVTYTVKSFSTSLKVVPGMFTFPAEKHPGVDLIDNRI